MSIRLLLLIGLLPILTGLPTASADEPADLTLRYRELTGRQELKFVQDGKSNSKPAGMLNWDFPPTSFSSIGFETAPRTFCIEPQVPVTMGQEYPFRVEQFGTPRDFGLKDDEEGRKAATRRMKFVRELYGRFYPDAFNDAATNSAFQAALWEVIGETDVPEGPMPFSLFGGTFKADYKEADAPEFVRTAQKYVQALTGNDEPFTSNTLLAGQELVRLTGLKSDSSPAAQSQIALRSRGGSGTVFGQFGDSNGGPGLGGLGGALSGLGAGNRSPLSGLGGGFGGGGAGGAPFVGGGVGAQDTGTPSTNSPATTTTIPTGTDSRDPSLNPILNGNNGGGNTGGGGGNNGGTPGGGNNGGTPGGGTGTTPDTTPIPDPNPIPAPPAVVLVGVALAALGLKKKLLTKKAD